VYSRRTKERDSRVINHLVNDRFLSRYAVTFDRSKSRYRTFPSNLNPRMKIPMSLSPRNLVPCGDRILGAK